MNLERFLLRAAVLLSIVFIILGVYFRKWEIVITWAAFIAMVALDKIVSDKESAK